MAEIDGLRFIAIMGVLVTHAYDSFLSNVGGMLAYSPQGLTHIVMGSAGRGVELFFVISGFILGLPFAKAFLGKGIKPDLKKYFWRRITRLEPPYVLIMLVFFLLRAFPAHPSFASDYDGATLIKSFVASLFYCHYIVFGERPFLNPIAWSLEVEVQFYILAPLIARLLYTLPKAACWVFGAMLVVSAPFIQDTFGLSRNTILGQYQYFLTGMMIARYWVQAEGIHLPRGLGLISSILLFAAMFTIPLREQPPIYPLIFNVSLFCFFMLSLTPGATKSILSFPYTALTGGMCYSIYLIHWQLLVVVGLVFGPVLAKNPLPGGFPVNYAVFFVGVMVPVFIFSVSYFLLIEKPCMNPRWPQDLWVFVKRRLPAKHSAKP